jgi:hypothetical protein
MLAPPRAERTRERCRSPNLRPPGPPGFDPEGSGPLGAQERHFPPRPGRRSDRWASGGNRASVPPFSAAFVVNRVGKCDYTSDNLRVLQRLTGDPCSADAPRSQARRSCRSVAAGRGRECARPSVGLADGSPIGLPLRRGRPSVWIRRVIRESSGVRWADFDRCSLARRSGPCLRL